MTRKEEILTVFQGLGENLSQSTVFLPDLIIWYNWHSRQGTLPKDFIGMSLEDTCRALGVPIWNTCRSWKLENSEVEVDHFREEGKRVTQYKYGERTLRAVWTKGPDGDWWQTEYPVKTVDDLEVIKAYVEGRTFKMQTGELSSMLDKTGEDGIVAPQLPPRAFSWLMLELLGWSEGLMVLMDGEKEIGELVTLADSQIRDFTRTMADQLRKEGVRIYLSPDNLDGMFVSPGYFEQYLAGGYQAVSRILHDQDSFLMVHGGGPLGRILEQIGQSGIDCMAGVCGPPQGDTLLEDARNKVGDSTILWGGIPQDYLIEITPNEDFERNTREIVRSYSGDALSITGIADHVSIDTDISRLKRTVEIIEKSQN